MTNETCLGMLANVRLGIYIHLGLFRKYVLHPKIHKMRNTTRTFCLQQHCMNPKNRYPTKKTIHIFNVIFRFFFPRSRFGKDVASFKSHVFFICFRNADWTNEYLEKNHPQIQWEKLHSTTQRTKALDGDVHLSPWHHLPDGEFRWVTPTVVNLVISRLTFGYSCVVFFAKKKLKKFQVSDASTVTTISGSLSL